MTDCLFCRIVAGEIPATVVAVSERALAFRDIAPKAPTHVLVIPKTHYDNAAEMAAADPQLAGEMLALAGEVAAKEGVAADGYRLMFNTGAHGGQEVFHAHLHVLGGKPLGPMLAA
ncbi:MAG: histidine triad nucleotide-binding protein [Stackebrandtia sp.]